ncbi:MAG: hypothetical protein P4L87_05890 [Formivibrio sp.]|nr:hypothetical protein [Formivibrio sp.]
MNSQSNTLLNWINNLPTESSPREGVASPRPPRPSPTVSPTEKHSQPIDLYTSHRLPDCPRPFFDGSGLNAPRSGAAQDQYGADILTDDELKFWQQVVDQIADFLGCDADGRAMLHRHLIEQGRTFVPPLRDLVRAYGLPNDRLEFY